MEAKKFRKKPVVIEAMLFDGTVESGHAVMAWVNSFERHRMITPTHSFAPQGGLRPVLRIYTLEGDMDACPGDYVIRGVKGEFYPCKPDIFEQTYEEVLP